MLLLLKLFHTYAAAEAKSQAVAAGQDEDEAFKAIEKASQVSAAIKLSEMPKLSKLE